MPDFSNFLIASDLDGTFLDKSVSVVQRNLDAIARFHAGGGLFTANTGRPHLTLSSSIPQVEQLLSAPSSHCNGAYLYDFQTGEFLLEEFLAPEDVADILAFSLSRHPDVSLRAVRREHLLVHVPKGVPRPHVLGSEKGVAIFDLPMEDWPLHDWYKAIYIGDPARIAALRRDFAATFGERFGRTSSSAHALEIQLPHSSKAVGLEKMCRLSLETSRRTIIACGDYENDIPMLKAADIAICPANAHPDTKAVCDFVLCDCDEGLIGDIVDAIEAGKIRPKQK